MKYMKKIFCIVMVLSMLAAIVLLPMPASAVTAPEVLGASIRTSGTQGLRFVARVIKSGNTLYNGNTPQFGILLYPKYLANGGTNITKSTANVKDVPAARIMTQAEVTAINLTYDSSYVYFCAVMTGIPTSEYDTEILARAYIGTTYSTQLSRSVRYVANGAGLTSIVSTADSEAGLFVDVSTLP